MLRGADFNCVWGKEISSYLQIQTVCFNLPYSFHMRLDGICMLGIFKAPYSIEVVQRRYLEVLSI